MKRSKNILNRVSVDKPCAADWDKMIGNEAVRFCEHCAKSVNNLSAMTSKEAEKLVAASNGNLCVRYHRTSERKIVTLDFPVQITRAGRRVSQFAASIFTAAIAVSSATAQGGAIITPDNSNETVVTQTEKQSDKTPSIPNSIVGFVVDATGAVIPNITVVLLDKDDNEITRTTSDSEEGSFQFQNLLEGTYNIKAEAGFGFGQAMLRNVKVTDGRTTQVDIATAAANGEMVTMGIVAFSSPVTDWIRHTDKRMKTDVEIDEKTMDFFNNVVSDEFSDVKRALRGGMPVESKMSDGETALMYAASPKMARLLLKRGANLRAQSVYGETALMTAASKPETIKFFIAAGLDVNATSAFGVTPLMYAMEYGDESETVDLLLAAGAQVNVKDVDGRTALMLAAFENKSKIIKSLIAAGADVNASDNTGKTVLMYAVSSYAADEEAIKLLIDSGARVAAADNDGKSVLKYAENDEEIVKFLTTGGTDD